MPTRDPNGVSIVGVGQVPVLRAHQASLRELGADTVRRAMADAGTDQVDALFVGNMLAAVAGGVRPFGDRGDAARQRAPQRHQTVRGARRLLDHGLPDPGGYRLRGHPIGASGTVLTHIFGLS